MASTRTLLPSSPRKRLRVLAASTPSTLRSAEGQEGQPRGKGHFDSKLRLALIYQNTTRKVAKSLTSMEVEI